MEYLINLLPAIITGLFLYYWQRQQNKRDNQKCKEEKLRDEAEEIDREVNSATMELAYASAMAIKRGKANGEVEAAVNAYTKAKKHQEKFNQKLQQKIIKRGE